MIMEKLIKKEGVYYTHVANDMPIEERVFFREGLVADINDYRPATPEELQEWEAYKRAEEERMNIMGGGTDNG